MDNIEKCLTCKKEDCNNCMKSRKEYFRKWNKNNKDKISKYHIKWFQKNLNYYKEYYQKNKEKKKQYNKEYYKKVKERKNKKKGKKI